MQACTKWCANTAPTSIIYTVSIKPFRGRRWILHRAHFHVQITAIILQPHFPGLLAPLTFNPLRFAEFASFSATVVGTWVGVSLLVGGYKTNSTAGAPSTNISSRMVLKCWYSCTSASWVCCRAGCMFDLCLNTVNMGTYKSTIIAAAVVRP